MENRNVTTFVKIVEAGSFTKAAELLGYSQAAVTAQIKAMEKELGVPLFDRIGKRVYLTQEGKTFLPHALNMLRAEEEAIHSVRQTEHLSGELSICSASSYAMDVLPDILLKFTAMHPDVNVTVRISDFVEDSTSRLARGEIDFVVCLDEEYAYPEFLTMAKKQERVVFVTYPENPLAEEKGLKASDVVRERFIVADRDISYCAFLDKELRKQGTEMKPAMEIGSVGAITRILLNGYGCSFIPEFAVKQYVERGELKLLDVSDIDISICSYFICSKDRWINPIMREFIRFAEEIS